MIGRRDFLKSSAAGAAALVGGLGTSRTFAAPITVPTVDRLSARVLVDSSFDLFIRPAQFAGVNVTTPPRTDATRNLHSEWGLSLYLESQRGSEQRNLMLDFGYSAPVLLNNIEVIGVDPARIDTLIVSHGFLNKYRGALPADLKLYAGGEDNFCHRLTGPENELADFGTLDRRALAAQRVTTVLCETPTVIAGHAFTTGKIARNSLERVLPNTRVEFAMKDGLGCDAAKYVAADMVGKTVPDEHIHEHATCFNVKDKGLVVMSSCGHVGIVNSVRQAQEVSGVQKVHAVLGGFHLGPAPPDYLTQVVAEIKKLEPDVLIPMHCSGLNFVQEARRQMPDKVLVTTTGSRLTFGA
jgi:7,8-dihydropterin-6-yl-methyl-4-(beta-D-ribofuranosyl)aminobenzene 5'-phosphate synthase